MNGARLAEKLNSIRGKLFVRMDAEENSNANEPRKKASGVKLPYGLCKGLGIDTTGMTPSEAWESYTKKTGVSASAAYKSHYGTGKSEIDGLKTNPKIRTYMKEKHGMTVDTSFSSVAKTDESRESVKRCLKAVESGLKNKNVPKKTFDGMYITSRSVGDNSPMTLLFPKKGQPPILIIDSGSVGDVNGKLVDGAKSGKYAKNTSVESFYEGLVANGFYADFIANAENEKVKKEKHGLDAGNTAQSIVRRILGSVKLANEDKEWAKGKAVSVLSGEISSSAKDEKNIIREVFSDCAANGKAAHPFSIAVKNEMLKRYKQAMEWSK